MSNFGTMTKALHCGMAAQNGLRAALSARDGFTASGDIIETELGFAETVAGCGDSRGISERLRGLPDALGSPFKVADRIRLKNYPSCAAGHSAVDAVLRLRAEHGIAAADITEIIVTGVPHNSPVLRYPAPVDGLQAKFSMTYNVALAAVKGAIEVDDFDVAAVSDPRITEMIGKIRIEVLPLWGRRTVSGGGLGTPVTIRLRGGATHRMVVTRDEIRGSVKNPLTDEEIERKFRRNAARAVDDPTATATLFSHWTALPSYADVSELLQLTRDVAAGAVTVGSRQVG